MQWLMEVIVPGGAFSKFRDESELHTPFVTGGRSRQGIERRWMLLFGDLFSMVSKTQVGKAWVLCVVCLGDNLRVRDNVERS